MQTYSFTPGRLNRMAGQVIGHAMATEVLSVAVQNMDMPKNKSETMVVRSWVPYGGTVAAPNTWTVDALAHLTQEGVTPNADTIVPRDVVFTLNQYAALYSLTDKDFDLYEDDIAAQMKIQLGERMGLVREMAIYAQMKAATAKFYGGFGSTRASVNAAISDRLISAITRSLAANHAKRITKILSPAQAYGSTSVEASFVCYAHTDLEYDIRRLPGFRETAAYAQRKVISDFELGTWQNVRFVISADLNSIPNAGFAVGSTGLKSTGGSNIDVYPMIFLSQDAFAQVKLRGANAIDMSVIMPNQKDSSDPLGQRGYIGAKFWHTSGILNPGWIVVAEVGVDALAA